MNIWHKMICVPYLWHSIFSDHSTPGNSIDLTVSFLLFSNSLLAKITEALLHALKCLLLFLSHNGSVEAITSIIITSLQTEISKKSDSQSLSPGREFSPFSIWAPSQFCKIHLDKINTPCSYF